MESPPSPSNLSDNGDPYAPTRAYNPSGRRIHHPYPRPNLSYLKTRQRISKARDVRWQRQMAYFADFMAGLPSTLLNQLHLCQDELPRTLKQVLEHPLPAHITPAQRSKSFEMERAEDLIYSTFLEALMRSHANAVYVATAHALRYHWQRELWWSILASQCHRQLQQEYSDPATRRVPFAAGLPQCYPLRCSVFTHATEFHGPLLLNTYLDLSRGVGWDYQPQGYSVLVTMKIGPSHWGIWLDAGSLITNAIRRNLIPGAILEGTTLTITLVNLGIVDNVLVAREPGTAGIPLVASAAAAENTVLRGNESIVKIAPAATNTPLSTPTEGQTGSLDHRTQALDETESELVRTVTPREIQDEDHNSPVANDTPAVQNAPMVNQTDDANVPQQTREGIEEQSSRALAATNVQSPSDPGYDGDISEGGDIDESNEYDQQSTITLSNSG